MTYPVHMNSMYMPQADQYSTTPISFSNVPDLISCTYDDDTDPSPSPPVVRRPRYPFRGNDQSLRNSPLQTYPSQFSTYDYSAQPQPRIVNSVEFTDLTQLHADDQARWQRSQQQSHQHQPSSILSQQEYRPGSRSAATTTATTTTLNTTQDSKQAASNMRIRRRAQNRASQRAFRERKEKHVQHLEHELEQLDAKHQHLAKSYTDLDSRHAEAQEELAQLRNQLASLRTSSRDEDASTIMDGATIQAGAGVAIAAGCGGVGGGQSIKRENTSFFADPFATDAYFGSGSTTSDINF